MDIEWCVFDLDGTLLNDKGCLTNETIAAVHQVIKAGRKVILATGRSHLFVKDIAFRLGVVYPIISCNGGLIVDIGQGDVLFSKSIDDDSVLKLAEYCLHHHYDTLVYSHDHIYYSGNSKRISQYQRYNTEVKASFQIPLEEMRVGNLPRGKVVKFFVWGIDRTLADQFERDMNGKKQLAMVSSARGALDIMAKDISKGNGLTILGEKIGIDFARTMVFGDNFNDISMLRLAGYPIAVGNAEAEVKAVARYVTGANDENGVAEALRKYILLQ